MRYSDVPLKRGFELIHVDIDASLALNVLRESGSRFGMAQESSTPLPQLPESPCSFVAGQEASESRGRIRRFARWMESLSSSSKSSIKDSSSSSASSFFSTHRKAKSKTSNTRDGDGALSSVLTDDCFIFNKSRRSFSVVESCFSRLSSEAVSLRLRLVRKTGFSSSLRSLLRLDECSNMQSCSDVIVLILDSHPSSG